MSDMERACDLASLAKAYKRAMRGKRGRVDAIRFSVNVMEGLCMLKWHLESGKYSLGKYTEFSVERPMHRDVKSCAFKDKIVLGSLSKSVLWNAIEPHLISDNYASRKKMGTHLALDRLEQNLHNYFINYGMNGWVLRIDARKYFYNLSHDLIKEDLRTYDLDDWTLWLCGKIVDSSHHSVKPGYLKYDDSGRPRVYLQEGNRTIEVGSPIGNETSQVFAVEYLNGIDHFIKDQCGIKYYGRYMDDSYIICNDRAKLERLKVEITEQYARRGLELNDKTQISPLKNGVMFLGMHLYLTETGKVIRRLRPSNIRYARVHIRENAEAVADQRMTEESFWKRYAAWDNHASYADAYKVRQKMHQFAKEALNHAYSRKQRELGKIGTDVSDDSGAEV